MISEIGTTHFLAAHFAKQNTKNCGGEKRSGESEGGQKFLPRRVAKRLLRGVPPNPLPFCPPAFARSAGEPPILC